MRIFHSRRRFLSLALPVISSLALTACINVNINAADLPNDTEVRPLATSTKNLVLDSPLHVKVSYAPTASIVISGSKSQFPNVITTESNGTLNLTLKGRYENFPKLHVDIKLPDLALLDNSNSGSATVEGFKGNQFKLIMSGSGSVKLEAGYARPDIELNGSGSLSGHLNAVENLNLNLTGSGSANLTGDAYKANMLVAGSGALNGSDFKVANLTLNLTGSGSAYAFAKDNADVLLRGSGSAHIYGNPATRNAVARGSGNIHWK